ncbi:MAG: ABC transporter permease [Candidatus Kapabacteria bacterium]|nr:ABC transporter permease [Candidatus Kapabacteria bacterium]
MVMPTLTIKLFREVRHMRGQMIAIILVIAAGIANYVAFQSTHSSLVLSQQAYYDASNFGDIWVQVRRAPEALRERIASIDGVTSVDLRVVASVVIDIPGLIEPAGGIITSVPNDAQPTINRLSLKSGRWIEPRASDEVIVSYAFATANGFREGDTVNAVINGRWKPLRIVATALSPEWVLELVPGSMLIDNKRFAVMWMGHDALSALYDMSGAWNSASIDLAPGSSVSATIDRLDVLLRPYGSTGAIARVDQMSHKFLSDEIRQLSLTALIVPLIFLGVAIFLLNISLLRFVTTQRAYIAILKAFGYSNARISMHYVGFAIVAVAGGTVLGLAGGVYIGIKLVQMYLDFYRLPVLEFDMPVLVVISAIIMSLLAASLGAIAAVRAIVRLPPAEAMRPEAPRSYRGGILERSGLTRLFGPVTSMIVRNVLRRPLRAGVSLMTIALALSLLVLGRYFMEMFGTILDVQFNSVAREDAAVTFMTPRSHVAVHDLAALPGVMAVEPFRAIAVDVIAGQKIKRTAVTAGVEMPDLHRVTDMSGEPQHIPRHGVACSRFMAEAMGFGVGDTIQLRQIDEQRRTFTVAVTAVIDDMMGVQVYVATGLLSDLLHEQGSISGAFLQIDPARMQDFYRAIKKLPSMSSVVMRERAMRSFDESYMQFMDISNYYIVFFASLIAFGVVFNNARIALSERGNELASLRVLGFTAREVSIILLGEQLVLTLAALPLGLLWGVLWSMWMPSLIATDLFRFPFSMSVRNLGISSAMILAVAVITGAFIRRRIGRLDMIAVLKSHE